MNIEWFCLGCCGRLPHYYNTPLSTLLVINTVLYCNLNTFTCLLNHSSFIETSPSTVDEEEGEEFLFDTSDDEL